MTSKRLNTYVLILQILSLNYNILRLPKQMYDLKLNQVKGNICGIYYPSTKLVFSL